MTGVITWYIVTKNRRLEKKSCDHFLIQAFSYTFDWLAYLAFLFWSREGLSPCSCLVSSCRSRRTSQIANKIILNLTEPTTQRGFVIILGTHNRLLDLTGWSSIIGRHNDKHVACQTLSHKVSLCRLSLQIAQSLQLATVHRHAHIQWVIAYYNVMTRHEPWKTTLVTMHAAMFHITDRKRKW